jgi:competence ComEA-like helix-hairpin-helix protein
MKRLKRLAERITLTRSESAALLVIVSLYLVGFTWRYIQQTSAPFDPKIYAGIDSLIASGGLTPSDTLPKVQRHSAGTDSLAADSNDAAESGPLNINEASMVDLISLPGIGPALAGRILAYRKEHGRFGVTDDLMRVKGIGPAKLKQIRGLVEVR